MVSDVLHIMSELRSAGVSQVLRERGKATWMAAVSHPMVRQIGDGTLPHPTFRRYFEQNVPYLIDYARAIGLILGKAPDMPAIDVLARFLNQIVSAEIPANLAFLGRLGGATEATGDPAAMLPDGYAYTRHLLCVAAQGSCAEGLAAVLPCQWSYAEFAAPLMAALPADPVYADWISMFGVPGYGSLVEETTGLLDRLACSADDSAMDRLTSIFDISIRYESQFWEMVYRTPPHGDA
jgi:thiaminase (transcriptional activator TenA)